MLRFLVFRKPCRVVGVRLHSLAANAFSGVVLMIFMVLESGVVAEICINFVFSGK